MPDVEGGGLFGSAVRAAKEGLSAGAWIRAIREAGQGIRRQVALKLFAEAKNVAAEAGQEPTRDLREIPTLAEMPPVATRATEAVLQTVRLVYRERVTGKLKVVFHSTKSDTGITRQAAISNAIGAYASSAEEYEQELVGAVHTSAVRLVPVTVGE